MIMNRRTYKKLDKYKRLPARLINKFIYSSIRNDLFFSVSIGGKCYIMANDGRIFIYSYVGEDGQSHFGNGFKYWNKGRT